MYLTFFYIFIGIYLLIMLGMFLFQRRLMYYPEVQIFEPKHYGIENVKVIPLVTEDGFSIEAWHVLQADTSLPLIVYYHGNAGHIGDRMAKISHFAAAGFGILAVSYRGYGNSKGVPSERGLYEDARTALHHALKELGLKPHQVVLYGESLGSGIATHTAKVMADNGTPVGGLVLEAPYTSVARRSQEMYPFIPASFLVRDKFHSIDKIAHIDCPLMIFHGERDTVIPIHHGRSLLEMAKEPKRGHFFDDVDHTQFDYPTLAQHLLDFARDIAAPLPEKPQKAKA